MDKYCKLKCKICKFTGTGNFACLFLMFMKLRHYIGAVLLLLSAVMIMAFDFTGKDDFDLARQEIMLREVGHRVLLQAGDSTSRVMPVKKINENEYQIRFEKEFTFQSDSLVQITSRALGKNKLAGNYIVNVLDCSGKAVVYGFAMSDNKHNNIFPCAGRRGPKGCYIIDIKFESPGLLNSKKGYMLGGIPLLAFIGLMLSQSFKKRKDTVPNIEDHPGQITIGQIAFDPLKRELRSRNATTELTAKENKLLLIFAQSPNVIIARNRLQKEIWEDEGVIVGRSLDMFISKLRKKLEIDPSIQLVNIHGKGYKLEFGS